MSQKQEYKIVNQKDDSEVFFFAHSFKSALQHAEAYIERNSGKFPMKLYHASSKPKPFPRWEFMREV